MRTREIIGKGREMAEKLSGPASGLSEMDDLKYNEADMQDAKDEIDRLREEIKLFKKQAMRLRDEISYHESLGNRME